jgi:hypothetical protein
VRSFLLTERIEIFDFEENDTVDETWCEVKRKLHQQEDEDNTGAAAGENEGRGGELAANSTADATNSATIDATNAAATDTEVSATSATTATTATAATTDAATAAATDATTETATDTATDAAAVMTPQHLTPPVAIAVAKNSKPEIRNLFAVIADDKNPVRSYPWGDAGV